MSWDYIKPNLGWLAGGISALITFGSLQLGAWQLLEQVAYTQLFRLRGATDWNSQVVVVGIDDASLSALGQYPWDRKVYSDLLAQLSPAEPSVIAFDIVFADPSPADEDLAAAFARQGRVVLAQGWDAENQLVSVTPVLENAAIATGHIRKLEDPDRITRRIEPNVQNVPVLGIAAAQVYASVSDPEILRKNPGATLAETLLINWPSASRHAPHYSFSAVLSGEIPASTFTDKIVLIGATATGLDQNLMTPFDLNPPASGVYLHAATVNSLLQQNFIRQLPTHGIILILLIGGPGLGWMIVRFQMRIQVVVGAAVVSGIVVTGVIALHQGYWLPMAWPMALVGFTVGGCILACQHREKSQLYQAVGELQQSYSALRIDGSSDESSDAPSDSLANHAAGSKLSRQHSLPTLVQVADSLAVIASQVSRLIWKDELTQIGNRRSFDRMLAQVWHRSMADQCAIAVLLCDVDFFKKFNDTYGHLEGDRCLQQVADAIQSTVVSASGFVARYGGEEFAIILPNTDATSALHLARSTCSTVKKLGIAHASSTVSQYVTLSIGVAIEFPRHNSLSQVVVAAADQALYQAKSMGRNRATLFYDTTRYPASPDESVA